MDMNLYIFTEVTDEDEIYYVLKKVVTLPEKPYCCLRVGGEVYIGCDFNIAVFRDGFITHTIKIEHRITHLFRLGDDHILATGNWNLTFHVISL